MGTTIALPAPDANTFPDALTNTPHWVGYAWETRKEERTKVPKNPHWRPDLTEAEREKIPKNASTTNPATWADFQTARAFALRHGYGLGFILAPPFVGVDLDHCRDAATGELSTLGVSVLGELDTYAEVSISGTGVKAIAYGEKPGERCRKNGLELEIYSGKRLFALTGARLDDAPLQINDCQDAIDHIYTVAFGQPAPAPSPVAPAFVTDDDDRTVIDWLTTYNPKFAPLWAGDTGAYNGDQSAADQALCNMLAFRTGDENRVDRLFRLSGLYRQKWERGDYRHRTITKAMQQRRFFTPPTGPTLSSVDTPLADGMTGDCAARLALLQQALDAEREHRKAVHALMTNEGMTPVERVIAYGLVFAVASAASRDEHSAADPEARPVNCSAIAENVGLKPQTVSANISRFAERGHFRKVTSPKATRDGKTYREIAVHLPGGTVLENLRTAASWTRPAGTPHVGGNGRRCPRCDSAAYKRTERTATLLTTTIVCADCGHIHDTRIKELPGAETYVEYGDFTDTPAMLDLAAMRGERTLSSADSPPQPEAAPASDLATVGEATLSSADSLPLSPHDTNKTVDRPRIIPRYPLPPAGPLSSVDSPPAPPVASWDGTHPCRDCGATCYARSGTVPRCLPCTRGRHAAAWGDVAAGDD